MPTTLPLCVCRRCRGRPRSNQNVNVLLLCPSDAYVLVRRATRRCSPSAARTFRTPRTTFPGAGVRLACFHVVDLAQSRPEVSAQVRKPGAPSLGRSQCSGRQASRTLGSTPVTSRMTSLILSVLDQTRRDRSALNQSIVFWYSACWESQISVLEVGRAGRLHERVLRQYDRRLCPRAL